MNNQSILLDQLNSFISSEAFFKRQNIDWINGSVQLFLVLPITSLGIILNLISFYVVSQIKEHHLFLFRILKIMCLNSAILNLCFVFSFYKDSSRYIGYRYDLFERIIECVSFPFFNSLFYWTDTVIDMFLSLERLSIFIKNLKIFTNQNAYLLYSITLIACSIMNVPSLLRSYPRSDSDMLQVLINSINSTLPVKRCTPGPLSSSPLILINILLRDIISLIIQISLSVLVLYYFIKFQTKKALLNVQHKDGVSHPSNHNKQESKLSSLTLCISGISFISHLAVALLFSFNFFNPNPQITGNIAIVSTLSVVIKNALNFVILYNINNKFKKIVLGWFYKNVKNNDIGSSDLTHTLHHH